jgi:pyruvate/2-oxoglutarate dehydrogenase complex dihydrolipoamide dehydrogenase (E3) component
VYQNWQIFVLNANTERFEDVEAGTLVHTTDGTYEADAVLLATGRKPNTDLNLENTDIELGEHGEIKVNEHLQTTAAILKSSNEIYVNCIPPLTSPNA